MKTDYMILYHPESNSYFIGDEKYFEQSDVGLDIMESNLSKQQADINLKNYRYIGLSKSNEMLFNEWKELGKITSTITLFLLNQGSIVQNDIGINKAGLYQYKNDSIKNLDNCKKLFLNFEKKFKDLYKRTVYHLYNSAKENKFN